METYTETEVSVIVEKEAIGFHRWMKAREKRLSDAPYGEEAMSEIANPSKISFLYKRYLDESN